MLESKHRETIYHQLCMEIMRAARDLPSLSAAASRALNRPEVVSDPTLSAMVRSFVTQSEARLRVDEGDASERTSDSHAASPFTPAPSDVAAGERARSLYNRLRLRLEEHLAQYNETGAADVLVSLWDLHERHPAHVARATVERCQEQVRRLGERREAFRTHLGELLTRVRDAVAAGDERTAGWLIRRLDAIHTLLPQVLSAEQLEQVRQQALRDGRKQESREALAQLRDREKSVAAEIQRLGAMVHRCRRLCEARAEHPEISETARTELNGAIRALREHGREWLATLMLELDALLDDLRDADGKAHAQVDRFVQSVRQALVSLREQVRELQRGGSGSGGAPV